MADQGEAGRRRGQDRFSRWRGPAAALSTTALLAGGCELGAGNTPENQLDPFGVVVRHVLTEQYLGGQDSIDWTLFKIGAVPVGKNPFTDAPPASLTEANKRTHAAIVGLNGHETARTTFEAKCLEAELLTSAKNIPAGVLLNLVFEVPQSFADPSQPLKKQIEYVAVVTEVLPALYRYGVQAQRDAQDKAARGDRTGAEGWKAENAGDAGDAFDIGSKLCRDDSVTAPLDTITSLGDVAANAPIKRDSLVIQLCAENCASDSLVPIGPDFVPYTEGLSEKGWELYQKLIGSSSTGPSESPAALRTTALGFMDRTRRREPQPRGFRLPRTIYPSSGK